MPRQTIPLTDSKIKALRGGNKPRSAFDGGGLYLLVNPKGSKWWRFKYRFGGKTKTLSFGTYPEIGLKEARERREQARKLLANGTDPSADRKEQKKALASSATTFAQVFEEWLDVQAANRSQRTIEKIRASMRIHALPSIGHLSIDKIDIDPILELLRAIEKKGALEMARRVRAWTSRVFRYAVITKKCKHDPAANLRGALRVPVVRHHAALPKSDLPAFLKALDNPLVRLAPLTRLALKLLVLTATRPGELRMAKWKEFDFDKGEWRIPASRMKMKQEHIVPLSSQALATVEQTKNFSGEADFLFPALGNPKRTLCENTLGNAAKALGFPVTAHGFRSTFSTYVNESERWSSDAIEAQLSHKPVDQVRGAYYRGDRRLSERRRMMQWWADELDRIRST